MISPDYFSLRWSWYRPILGRQEQPANRCRINVRRLPIHTSGQDTGEYISFALHPDVEHAITTSIQFLHDLTIRYMVRGEKISAHKLPAMDERVRAMVTWLKRQHPHISRDLLHHWCADEKGAKALLNACEVLWEQGWKQDKADAAPWVPAVNVLLLRLIRERIARLPDKETMTTGHVLLCVLGSLYLWALQEFLKRYLEGVVEVARIANYESMMLPATPLAFMPHQPDDSLLADDSRLIRAYGLEPEIVPQLRFLLSKVGQINEGGILALLTRDKLGTHMLQRSWARLSLWKLAIKTGQASWMRWVLNAKQLDQLLAGQTRLDDAALETLRSNRDEPVAEWLLAQQEKRKMDKQNREPWLRDKITLLAFRVFEEDVRVEIARRAAETRWQDRRPALAKKEPSSYGLVGMDQLRTPGGLRGGRNTDGAKLLEEAWEAGELVLIQPDVTKALHSGQTLSLHQGCLRIQWSEYLARIHFISNAVDQFIGQQLMPALKQVVDAREGIFLDSCSASGALMRGPVPLLTDTAVALRSELRKLWKQAGKTENAEEMAMPPLSMCIDIASEWAFHEEGRFRVAFSPAIVQADAAVARDAGVARLMQARDAAQGVKPIGGLNIEPVRSESGQHIHLIHNTGLALTAAAIDELTRTMSGKATMHSIKVSEQQATPLLKGFRLPGNGLDLLIVQRVDDAQPWLLLKAGRPHLAGIDTEVFELLDNQTEATRIILEQGLKHWQ